MPALNQNLIIYDNDTIVLSFTVVDATTTLGSTNYAAWWGLANADNVYDSTALELEAFSNITYDVTAGVNDCSSNTATQLLSSTLSPSITNYSVNIALTWTQTNGLSPGDYYHELVLIPRISTIGHQCRSTVAASGILTVEGSMFTNRPYR